MFFSANKRFNALMVALASKLNDYWFEKKCRPESAQVSKCLILSIHHIPNCISLHLFSPLVVFHFPHSLFIFFPLWSLSSALEQSFFLQSARGNSDNYFILNDAGCIIQDWYWAQCDKCLKWRRLPDGFTDDSLPDKW